jgi:hypothetical protein
MVHNSLKRFNGCRVSEKLCTYKTGQYVLQLGKRIDAIRFGIPQRPVQLIRTPLLLNNISIYFMFDPRFCFITGYAT